MKNSLAKHKLFLSWMVLFFIFLIVTVLLLIITKGARFMIFPVIILAVIFVLFCPIIIIDHKRASEYKKKEKEKAKELELKGVELEIEKEKLELEKLKLLKEPEKISGNFCRFCGASIDGSPNVCPNCGSSLSK